LGGEIYPLTLAFQWVTTLMRSTEKRAQHADVRCAAERLGHCTDSDPRGAVLRSRAWRSSWSLQGQGIADSAPGRPGCPRGARLSICLCSIGPGGRRCVPVHPVPVHRLAVPLVVLLMQVQAGRIQRYMAKVVADGPQIHTAVRLMRSGGVPQPVRRCAFEFIRAVGEFRSLHA
jgi:hypothetical protein